MAVSYADKKNHLCILSKWGWEARFDFSLKSAIKKQTFKFSQLLAACYMITKELSTQGLQFFQGVLHFSVLRLRAIEHITTGKPLSHQMPEPGRLGHCWACSGELGQQPNHTEKDKSGNFWQQLFFCLLFFWLQRSTSECVGGQAGRGKGAEGAAPQVGWVTWCWDWGLQ